MLISSFLSKWILHKRNDSARVATTSRGQRARRAKCTATPAGTLAAATSSTQTFLIKCDYMCAPRVVLAMDFPFDIPLFSVEVEQGNWLVNYGPFVRQQMAGDGLMFTCPQGSIVQSLDGFEMLLLYSPSISTTNLMMWGKHDITITDEYSAYLEGVYPLERVNGNRTLSYRVDENNVWEISPMQECVQADDLSRAEGMPDFTGHVRFTGTTRLEENTFNLDFGQLLSVDFGRKFVVETDICYTSHTLSRVVGRHVREIGAFAFGRCRSLTNITFPVVKFLGGAAFCSTPFVHVRMPLVETIRTGCFRDSLYLQSVDLPLVEVVGDHVFDTTPLLKEVSMPRVISLGVSCFRRSGIETVTLPMAQRISTSFEECEGLTSVTLGAVTEIGLYSFADCPMLREVTLPRANHVHAFAFHVCPALQTLYCPVGCLTPAGITVVNI